MIKKIKEGVIINTDNIKIAKVVEREYIRPMVEIEYYDDKKNSKATIYCDSVDEANELVDIILDALLSSKRPRVY